MQMSDPLSWELVAVTRGLIKCLSIKVISVPFLSQKACLCLIYWVWLGPNVWASAPDFQRLFFQGKARQSIESRAPKWFFEFLFKKNKDTLSSNCQPSDWHLADINIPIFTKMPLKFLSKCRWLDGILDVIPTFFLGCPVSMYTKFVFSKSLKTLASTLKIICNF